MTAYHQTFCSLYDFSRALTDPFILLSTAKKCRLLSGSIIKIFIPLDGSIIKIFIPIDGNIVMMFIPLDGSIVMMFTPLDGTLVKDIYST